MILLMAEIRRSPVEVGSFSPYLQGLGYIPGGAGFLNHQQYLLVYHQMFMMLIWMMMMMMMMLMMMMMTIFVSAADFSRFSKTAF